MPCTTITVIEPAATIAILDKGLTVDGVHPSQCATVPGKAIGFYLKMTLVHTRNVYAKIDITFNSPAGIKTATYSSLGIQVGTYEYFLGYTATTYEPGTYTLTNVAISDIRNQ